MAQRGNSPNKYSSKQGERSAAAGQQMSTQMLSSLFCFKTGKDTGKAMNLTMWFSKDSKRNRSHSSHFEHFWHVLDLFRLMEGAQPGDSRMLNSLWKHPSKPPVHFGQLDNPLSRVFSRKIPLSNAFRSGAGLLWLWHTAPQGWKSCSESRSSNSYGPFRTKRARTTRQRRNCFVLTFKSSAQDFISSEHFQHRSDRFGVGVLGTLGLCGRFTEGLVGTGAGWGLDRPADHELLENPPEQTDFIRFLLETGGIWTYNDNIYNIKNIGRPFIKKEPPENSLPQWFSSWAVWGQFTRVVWLQTLFVLVSSAGVCC